MVKYFVFDLTDIYVFRWHQNPKKQECPNTEEESTGISIQNIGGVFILILGGIIVSLTMLVVEFFYYKNVKTLDSCTQ